ncbi:DNA polymerase iota isoform X1 [Procambarus clarkii]|uniref:DNA polymerase iota isoform X1 n=2 Tax=Procambarus clarkii TaxID=6728 RepID=UPI0037439001
MDTLDDEINDEYGDQELWPILPEHHRRTILHIDIDCFYAQVEMVRNPSLRDKPLGIKQKNLMVTCNYIARSLGVKKSMWVKDALEFLPSLILIDGSDLTPYRKFSSNISAIAQTFSPHVERLGLDENFIDVTDIVQNYSCAEKDEIEGHVYGDKEPNQVFFQSRCGCGCQERLISGTYIARELRQQIFATTGITCCAGIAHNKLLAKLISGYHKPNQQTVLFPWQVQDFMNSLHLAKSIPGIGYATSRVLEELGISSVQQLQNSTFEVLTSKFDYETSKRLKDLSFGLDATIVKKSGRPQSIRIEDAVRKVTSVGEVRDKYYTLLERLLKLLADDGRVPASIRVLVRKLDAAKRFGHRETKQAPISSSLFSTGVINVSDSIKSILMNIIMGLFHKMVNTSKEFHLTLVGVGFNKFIERAQDAQTIGSFFSKRSREQNAAQGKDDDTDMKRIKLCQPCTSEQMVDMETIQMKSSEKIGSIENYNDSFENRSSFETCKNSTELMADKGNQSVYVGSMRKDLTSKNCNNPELPVSDDEADSVTLKKHAPLVLPSGIDKEVFSSLPADLQVEILLAYKSNQNTNAQTEKVVTSKQIIPKKNGLVKNKKIDNYFKSQVDAEVVRSSANCDKTRAGDSVEVPCGASETLEGSKPSCSYTVRDSPQTKPSSTNNVCDPSVTEASSRMARVLSDDIDPTVFNALPTYIQQEIIQEQELLKQMPHSSQLKRALICNNKKTNESVSILKYLKKKL